PRLADSLRLMWWCFRVGTALGERLLEVCFGFIGFVDRLRLSLRLLGGLAVAGRHREAEPGDRSDECAVDQLVHFGSSYRFGIGLRASHPCQTASPTQDSPQLSV